MLEKITESLYAHTGGKTIGNVGVIATGKGNFVIDTSMFPKIIREIRTETDKIGRGNVLAAIWTHYHLDHSGGSQEFHDVPVYAHRLSAINYDSNYPTNKILQIIENQSDERKIQMEGLKYTKPSKIYETSPYFVDEDNSIVLHKVGGHTNGSVLIHYVEENGIFAGDDLMEGIYPWGGDPTASPYEWINAMDKILEIKPKVIIPGHGPVLYNLSMVGTFKSYFSKIVEVGEKLHIESVPDDVALEQLKALDLLDNSKMLERKEGTIKQMYSVIKSTISRRAKSA